ncbi:MAG: peroxiredoxin [Pseudomonadales bacterium]|nr:peroxiredoxin [Pseudomonadales bacterium]
MKKLVFTALIAGSLATSAYAALDAGTEAPDFTAPASLAGKEFTYSLKDALATGPTVVYFYPSAFTQGCNIQAHTFAINMDKFKAAGANVVGVSLDSIERLNDFSADPAYCAGALPVVSDASGSISASYNLQVREAREGAADMRGVAIGHDFVERTTFVVTSDGKVAATVGGVSPEENVEKSLAVIQGLAKN